ncbi:hypothetical protein EX30DRAFT_307066 [Ascodesmis nigricans]|uniref:RING-type domain-containing protein n=1 Tax=Ascodesmis nigricans TaxID=341454 RepID=A0A4S2MW36_9PEZI|nr:hypothetical protein EX30DRAFT_307066 [Ascodesmis nigricans]
MDGFSLHCNNLRCRTTLDNRGVVTTCCHIFCTSCAETLRLVNPPPNTPRRCPACDTELSGPDDAVLAILNPADDYKTSVLSGLSPSVIMEIAGRGLAFWGYQVTQEVVYQEHCANALREKYTTLSGQLDTIIHEANTEIARLTEKVRVMEVAEEELKRKNHELLEGWREKGRKLAQTQELYDKLKRRTLISQVRTAADENLNQVLHHSSNFPIPQSSHHTPTSQHRQPDDPQFLGNGTNIFVDQQQFQPSHQRQPTPSMGMSMRRHREGVVQEPEFLMTGARVGNINGAGTSGIRRRAGSKGSETSDNGGRRSGFGMPMQNGMFGMPFFSSLPSHPHTS